VTTLGGGFSAPTSVAVDGSGNIYVADAGNTGIKEMPAGCASSACVVTLAGGPGSGFPVPNDIAVASGIVYFTDGSGGHVYELPAGCTLAACLIALGGGFDLTEGVAVDGSGNVYVANLMTNMAGVSQIPAGCTSSTCVIALGGGFHDPGGVAVDAIGNVIYVADFGVEEIPSGCTAANFDIT
jgi:DNA-binding beta-propeller fold protein YncE